MDCLPPQKYLYHLKILKIRNFRNYNEYHQALDTNYTCDKIVLSDKIVQNNCHGKVDDKNNCYIY